MYRETTAPRKALSIGLFLFVIAGLAFSVRTAEAQDCGSETVALGDFDADGYLDLVIGSPGSHVNQFSEAGVVNVLYGTENGPRDSGQQVWHLDVDDVPGNPEHGSHFGLSLAVGDFDCDGVDDLAIGEVDAVTVLYGDDDDDIPFVKGIQKLDESRDRRLHVRVAAQQSRARLILV